MTGRATGYCAGYPAPGYINLRRGYCRGFGRGWGRGSKRGCYCYPPVYPQKIQKQTPEQEAKALENYHKDLVVNKVELEKEINDIRARIEDIKKKSKE